MPTEQPSSGDELVILTHTTMITNPGFGGYAATWKNQVTSGSCSGGIEETTIPRLAMVAITEALQQAPAADRIRVYTATKYLTDAYQQGTVKQWRDNNWRRVTRKGGMIANADLWEALDDEVRRRTASITWVHGLPGGQAERDCRKLAKMARDRTSQSQLV